MQLMNIVINKEVFYHYGFFNMKWQKNLPVQILLGIHIISIYSRYLLDHVGWFFKGAIFIFLWFFNRWFSQTKSWHVSNLFIEKSNFSGEYFSNRKWSDEFRFSSKSFEYSLLWWVLWEFNRDWRNQIWFFQVFMMVQ